MNGRPRGTRHDASGRIRYTPTGPAPSAGQLSALPSRLARGLAFAAILVGGGCGALIGFGVARLQYGPGHQVGKAFWTIVGALIVSVGVAVLAVLVLRAMGEWHAVDRSARAVRLGDDD